MQFARRSLFTLLLSLLVTAQATTAWITVTSEPDVEIVLNGSPLGVLTSLRTTLSVSVAAGTHELELRRDGFHAQLGSFALASGEHALIQSSPFIRTSASAGEGDSVVTQLDIEISKARETPIVEENALTGAELADPNRPILGVATVFDVSDYPGDLQEELLLPPHGTVISAVADGTPAAVAGLQSARFARTHGDHEYPYGGDVIVGIDDRAVNGHRDLQRYLYSHTEPGDRVTLIVYRNGETIEVEVLLVALGDI